jgi:serine protease AprX
MSFLRGEIQETSAFVIGDVETAEIERLRDGGMLVEILKRKPPPAPRTRGLASVPADSDRVRRGDAPAPAPSGDFYKIEFLQPLLSQYHTELERLGIRLLRRLPESLPESSPSWEGRTTRLERRPEGRSFLFVAYLTEHQMRELAELPYVGAISRYSEADTLSADLGEQPERRVLPRVRGMRREEAAMADEGSADYDLRLHRSEDMAATLQWMRDNGVTVRSSSEGRLRVTLEDPAMLRRLAELPAVARIERTLEADLHLDHARRLLGVAGPQSQSSISRITLLQQGEGETVGVADTGIDHRHRDFDGRISGRVSRVRPQNDTSDPDGHGTHVAGCILGVAPKAKLYFQSLLGPNGRITEGIPDDLRDLFDEAYRNNVRVYNISWGFKSPSIYTDRSLQIDKFVAAHRDMLIVCSAGNYGTAANPLRSKAGFVDWLSIGSPATSKNGLTVGASLTDRGTGPSAHTTHGVRWNGQFPAGFMAQQPIAGNPHLLLGLSSRGPCSPDFRIKPDVVAPGTDILSTKSSQSPAITAQQVPSPFWGAGPTTDHAYCGGTSMAAPLVAGCALLTRQYFQSLPSIGEGPSAALLKATLVNSTKELTGQSATADFPDIPNIHQGFGQVYMPYAIPNPLESWLKLAFSDTWKTPALQLNETGDLKRFKVSCNAGRPLRFCLVYTDEPLSGLQNNLNMTVRLPGGTKRLGNEKAPSFGLGPPDALNNIEIVRIADPVAGNYFVEIEAANLIKRPQDYALVVTGDVTSDLTPVP